VNRLVTVTRRLSRRRVVAGLAGLSIASAGGFLTFRALQPARVPRIGFLAVGSREGRQFLIDALLQGLHERGYTEGENVLVEYRFSEDRDDRLPALAAELVALNVDVIVASGTPASFAAKQATATIPIVMGGVAADPIETGLVASLAHPGGNITGMSMMSAPLGGKRLELFKAIVPALVRVAVLWNPPNPAYGPVLKELETAAQTLGLKILRLEARVPADFGDAFAAGVRQQVGALVVPADPLTTNRQQVVADLALKHRLPTMMEYKEFARAGGLLGLGVDLADLYRRSATHVDKILKGANPGDLPMEQPTRLDVAVNLGTAQALGLTVPASILMQATEVIE
jgi:putative ABC transport system substrate-binding protein